MVKQNVTLTLEENIWTEFQVLCLRNKKKPSIEVENFMKNILKKNGIKAGDADATQPNDSDSVQ